MTAATALVGRGLSLGITLVTVPLTLGYLGPERYGVWVTMSSLVALLGFTDLGIANGALNEVTRCIAVGDRTSGRRAVASATWVLAAVALAGIALFVVSIYVVPWPAVVAAEGLATSAEVRAALGIALTCYLVTLPLNVAAQVRFARQQGWAVHVAATIGNFGSVAALLAVIAAHGGLPALAVAMGLPPIIAATANAILVYARTDRDFAPLISGADLGTARRLIRAGLPFFVIQVGMVLAFSSDALIVAQIVGPAGVAQYAVISRLFTIGSGIVGIGLAPLWPAYGEAVARHDGVWIRRTLAVTTRAAVVAAAIGAIGLVAASRALIRVWVGDAVEPPFWLIVGFGVWIVLSAVGTSVAMFLNGASRVAEQAVTAAAMAVANVALSILLTARFGVAGVIWGTVVSYAMLTLLPMAVYVPPILREVAPLERFVAADV